jgi:Flp pilus assembly protein CpaB
MKRSSLAGILAVLFALAAAAAVFLYTQAARQSAERSQQMVEVLVSTVDISAGQDLDALVEQGVFQAKRVPEQDMVQAVVTDEFQLRGQTTAYPILAGEQISATRFRGPQELEGGLLGIPGEHQAVSLTLEADRAVAGSLRVDDHVEVFGSFDRSKRGVPVTQVVVPDAEVLAVSGGSAEAAAATGGAVTVTLAVTPVEAALLVYAKEQGGVYLTLLPPNESGVVLPSVFGQVER